MLETIQNTSTTFDIWAFQAETALLILQRGRQRAWRFKKVKGQRSCLTWIIDKAMRRENGRTWARSVNSLDS